MNGEKEEQQQQRGQKKARLIENRKEDGKNNYKCNSNYQKN